MKKVVSKVFLAVAFLSFGFAQAQNGNGNGNNFTVQNVSTSDAWSQTVTNSCTGEVITLNGTLHTNNQIKTYYDNLGNVDYVVSKSSSNLSGVTGTGDLGNTYNYSFNQQYDLSFSETFPVLFADESISGSGVLVSKGNAPNVQVNFESTQSIFADFSQSPPVFTVNPLVEITAQTCAGTPQNN